MFSFTEVSTPSYGLATLNHQLRWMSVPAVLKTSKWVLSAFSFASSSPQGDSAADKDLNLTYPSLFIVRYTVHFQNWLPSSLHMEINLSFLYGV